MSKVIAFIIPNTFAKWSIQKNLAPGWKLIKIFDLPFNSFTDNGKDFQVNCLFQIWVREDQPGEDCRLQYSPAISCDDFECWQYNATQQAKNMYMKTGIMLFGDKDTMIITIFLLKKTKNRL